MIYVDTSLVVTSLDGSDPARMKAARTLLNKSPDRVVSELFLVELASAISRKTALMAAAADEGSPPPTVLLAYLVHLMSKFGLRLLQPSGDLVFTPLGKMAAEAGSALGLSVDLKLRSLDLLHVAHLLSMKDRGHNIEWLATSDADFLKAEGFLKERGVRLLLQS